MVSLEKNGEPGSLRIPGEKNINELIRPILYV